MQWMVALGQGARCSNKKNEYRIFREEQKKPMKLPVIPGVAEKCEHFENRYSNCGDSSVTERGS